MVCGFRSRNKNAPGDCNLFAITWWGGKFYSRLMGIVSNTSHAFVVKRTAAVKRFCGDVYRQGVGRRGVFTQL